MLQFDFTGVTIMLLAQIERFAENIRRGDTGKQWASKTHCPQGHLYDEKNTRISKVGGRLCKACNLIKSKRYYAKKRLELLKKE